MLDSVGLVVFTHGQLQVCEAPDRRCPAAPCLHLQESHAVLDQCMLLCC